ncbi:ferritin-like domain-containing protein [Hymenobacter sp. BT186]|uniref:Ferritin-like domain-containing protein n=1 Tax=Hymenobacter telluris TaxID=2816474 RepID=A0A939EUC2_9BACT|nr:ferritin-like domain-containing protein [Hymenobacter telluris]MBO0357588.1 ferritin-like domain-containing protein [Hymenobacter telluris]MBW3373614.1 ferritin-like domain-containing protein [Hymenobacter norwichensis]
MSTSFLVRAMQRRSFFKVAGASVAASTLVLAGCSDDPEPTPVAENVLAFSGFNSTGQPIDDGILNYAYLLTQLEAAFYLKVVAAPPADLQPGELAYLTDLRDHELIHREYLKAILGSKAYDSSAAAPLEFTFTSFTLTTRAGVWAAAQQLEDIGAAAYNGAGKLLTVTANLLALAKIASVESRHAALAHEMVQADSFGATIGADGLDDAKTPTEVFVLIQPFVPIKLSAANLPTT